MATRSKESAAAGRQRRGTSPSNSPQPGSVPQRRTRPSPSKATNQDSTASDKQIPNYLKPTISSCNDISKQQGKKPLGSESANIKTSLLRRRSFDKAPSPSSTQKTRISPNPTPRSSSFSTSKDAGKQSPLYSKPVSAVKKSGTYVVKKQDAAIVKEEETGHSGIVEATDEHEAPQPETKQEDQESATAEAETKQEETPQVESSNEMGTETLDLDDSEKIEEDEVEVETEETHAVSEEPEEASHIEETGSNRQELEEHTSNEISNTKTEENASDAIVVVEAEEKDGEHELNNKEGAGSGSEVTELQENAGEEKHEGENVAVQKQVPQGKKDSAVSNDVIEETASKLREQRKNKVKALAGAFETVISLQEPK